MHLMHEELARAHTAQRLEEAVRRRARAPSRRRPPGGATGGEGRAAGPPSPRARRRRGDRSPVGPADRRAQHKGPDRAPAVGALRHARPARMPCRGRVRPGGWPRSGDVASRRALDGRGRRPSAVAVQPRQGALSRDRLHQGRGRRLLRPRRRRSAAAHRRPADVLPALPRRRRGAGLLREERAARHAGLGAHGAAARAGQQQGPRDARLRRGRRPPDAGVGRQPGRPRAARAAVDRRSARRGAPTPTGWSSTSTPARPPRWSSAPRWRCCSRTWSRPTGWCPSPRPAGPRGCRSAPPSRRRRTSAPRRTPATWPSGWRRRAPDLVVSRMAKDLRGGKVFVDWSQNNAAKTTVAPYALRARPQHWVSTPVTWDEVEACRRVEDLRFLAPRDARPRRRAGRPVRPAAGRGAAAALSLRPAASSAGACGQRPGRGRPIFLRWWQPGPTRAPAAGRSRVHIAFDGRTSSRPPSG